ncbi:unnamed protein product [Pedinophyceae sp. YPF-701]|nr:unnamed protein product [Pedinophyceae sp. YPF-701]
MQALRGSVLVSRPTGRGQRCALKAAAVPRRPHARNSGSVVVAAATESAKSSASKRRKVTEDKLVVTGPKPYQQTIKQTVGLAGIGLHTAEYAHVRLCPAPSKTGRYFVRVPDGTLSSVFDQAEAEADRELPSALTDFLQENEPEKGRRNLQFFQQWVDESELGSFTGTFDDWLGERTEEEAVRLLERIRAALDAIPVEPEPEPVKGEPRVDAHVSYLVSESPHYLTLQSDSMVVRGAEHLLAALEASGIDNCRIEIEGGSEIPMVDSTAFGWCEYIMRAGQRASGSDRTPRISPVLGAPVHVADAAGAFMVATPADTAVVSAGVDWADVPYVGRQWHAWAVEDAVGFVSGAAPARSCIKSMEQAFAYRRDGLYKGAGEASVTIGCGDSFHDDNADMFMGSDPARHAVVDAVGALALLAEGGNAGLPLAHVAAWDATHALHAEFLQAVAKELEW